MENYTRKPNSECSECGKPLYRRPYQLAKGPVFCGRKCSNIRNKKEHTCLFCGSGFTRTHTRKKYCSHRCSTDAKAGQERQPNRDIPKRRLRRTLIELRGGTCECCGFSEERILQVHHIIKRSDGGSDELENLKLLCPNCHCLQHPY